MIIADRLTLCVFPTPVGVFLSVTIPLIGQTRFPHACGGVSNPRAQKQPSQPFSPRLWGCFSGWRLISFQARVFPTPVGVFPLQRRIFPVSIRFPHACGGVSILAPKLLNFLQFSPRLWGCFSEWTCTVLESSVFPTPVGVFLISEAVDAEKIGFPHACGGVSANFTPPLFPSPFSPRLWGCFYRRMANGSQCRVFPTPVGVFLIKPMACIWLISFPHACGGVSLVK